MSCAVLGAALLLTASPASASLTDSERAQVKGYIQGGQLATAQRVRSLVVRPDLSLEESANAIADAVVAVTFQPASAAYLHELVYGDVSLSVRPILAAAVTRAVVARAEAVLARDHVDQHPDALAELSRLYAFVGAHIANAGHPQGTAHDPAIGIPASTYDDCVRTLAEHVQRNTRWLSPEAPVSPAFQRVRAQEELALFDLMNDTPTRRVDAAAALGLTGSRKKLLTELGLLVLDSGVADDARVQRLRSFYARVGGLAGGSLGAFSIDFGDARPELVSRGAVVGVPVPLETPPSPVPSEEVDTVPVDLPLFMLAFELSKPAASRVLSLRPELREWADEDVQARGAPPGAMSTVERIAGMMAELFVDAPRAVDLSFSRVLAGRSRTAALLSDALGVIGTMAAAGGAAGLTVSVGRSSGNHGETERMDASGLRLASTGAALSFQLDRRRWDLRRDPTGEVSEVRCDGQPVTMAVLRLARVPVSEATSWTSGGLVFARLSGSPRAGVAAGSRIRVVGVGQAGVDAIATPSPSDDVLIEADLSVTGGEGGLVARAVSTKGAFQGVSLVLLPGAPSRAVLRLSDGNGGDANVGQPVEIPSDSVHAKLVVRGSVAEAMVGDVTLKSALPPALAHGDVALRAKAGATVEASGLVIRRSGK
jgi:hypothetical protein